MDDVISNAMDSLGYVGVALLMLLENIVPPIPSEIVMPAAGALARDGSHSLVGMILAGTIGSVAGALPWYGVARYIGTDRFLEWIDRHGHWLGTNRKEMQRGDRWFHRYGRWAVLGGRLVPGVRTIISVPAGFSEMPFGQFVLYTSIGTFAWSALLAGLGYWLQGQQDVIASTVKWIGAVVFAGLVLWFFGRIAFATFGRGRAERVSRSDSST